MHASRERSISLHRLADIICLVVLGAVIYKKVLRDKRGRYVAAAWAALSDVEPGKPDEGGPSSPTVSNSYASEDGKMDLFVGRAGNDHHIVDEGEQC